MSQFMRRTPSIPLSVVLVREAIAKVTLPRFKLVLLAILVVACMFFPGSVPVASATPGVIHRVTGFSGAWGIAFSPDGTYAYVTNRSSTTISKLDLSSNPPAIVDTIAVGSGPIGVAFTPDGTKAYVTNGVSRTISVVDTATSLTVGTIPSGTNVFRVIFNSNGTRAYVGIDGTNEAQIIDATTDTEIARVSVSRSSGGVALTPDEATLYVSAWSGADVSLIDLATNTRRKQISVGSGAMGVAAHPDGSKVYVSSSEGVSVISTETETRTKTVAGISGTYPLAIAPDGGEVYAATSGGTIYVVDTTSDTLVRTISTSGSYQLAVSPDCSRVITVIGDTATIVDTERDCSSNTVTFDANEGTGSMPAQSGSASSTLTSNTFARTGYNFAGWNSAADGSGTAYAEGATYDFSANLTFYAQWTAVAVIFDANEGTGSMSAQSGSSSSTLTSNTFTRTGYTFASWNSAADGSGTTYAAGATYDFSANLNLYAQWSVVVAAPASGGEASEAAAKPVAPARASLAVVPRRVVELGVRVAPVALPRDAQGAKSSRPVALVGGQEVVVKSEAKGSQAARYGAGKFVLDMGVEESDGTVDSVAGMPSVKIGRGGSAAVKGSGLQPSSRMQVFLPAADGSFIELPPVLVGTDGSFDAALTFATPERQRPLPIGKQFIQMFGVDEDGNQTVLEIPVTISQPLPVPEINRVSGERPVLSPGQSVAFNAGTPETVSLSRADETLSVVGEGWSFTVKDSLSNGNSQNLAFTRDAPMVFAGAGFMPGTRADVWLFSEPTLMGTVDIAADGTFEASFAVDSNFVPTGNHTLQIQGVGDDGFVRAANLGVVVGDLADTPLVPPGVDPFSWLPLILIATALGGIVTLVGVVVAMSRRRRLVGRLLPVG